MRALCHYVVPCVVFILSHLINYALFTIWRYVNIDKNRRQKLALLLHYVGDEVNDIFDTLTITEAGEDESLGDKAIDALSAYFQPKQNVAYEEYQFRQAKQDTAWRNDIGVLYSIETPGSDLYIISGRYTNKTVKSIHNQ